MQVPVWRRSCKPGDDSEARTSIDALVVVVVEEEEIVVVKKEVWARTQHWGWSWESLFVATNSSQWSRLLVCHSILPQEIRKVASTLAKVGADLTSRLGYNVYTAIRQRVHLLCQTSHSICNPCAFWSIWYRQMLDAATPSELGSIYNTFLVWLSFGFTILVYDPRDLLMYSFTSHFISRWKGAAFHCSLFNHATW